MAPDYTETIATLFENASIAMRGALSFASNCKRNCIVTPGFPILWFGDLDTYFKTPKGKRAISVGVNPSGRELSFDKSGRFIHFLPLKTKPTEIDIKDYIKSLNNYFINKPLGWFDKGMDLVPFSYKKGNMIHIDCCSTIATRPSWTGLCDPVISHLRTQNEPIFEGLLELLQPSEVYIASNQKEFQYIEGRCMNILKLAPEQIHRINKY